MGGGPCLHSADPCHAPPSRVTLLLHCSWSCCFLERKRWTHSSPHRGQCWGFSLQSAHSCLGLKSVLATCGREGGERAQTESLAARTLSKALTETQSVLEKQKGGAWTRAVPYCFSLGTRRPLPVCRFSAWWERHKRGAQPCKACFSSLCMGNCPNSCITFSPFSRAAAAPQISVCCKSRAALPLTHEGLVTGQAPVAKADLALPRSTCSCVERQQPAEVLTEDPWAHLSWRSSTVPRAM